MRWPGEALRLQHAPHPLPAAARLDTQLGFDEAHRILWEWYGDLQGQRRLVAGGVPGHVLDALSDDLNTPKAIAAMHELHSAG